MSWFFLCQAEEPRLQEKAKRKPDQHKEIKSDKVPKCTTIQFSRKFQGNYAKTLILVTGLIVKVGNVKYRHEDWSIDRLEYDWNWWNW